MGPPFQRPVANCKIFNKQSHTVFSAGLSAEV
jgi:hypothetical protein